MRKNLLAVLAVFFAAVLIGYFGERQSLHSSSMGTRLEMAEEAARVLRTLRPLLRADPLPEPPPPPFRISRLPTRRSVSSSNWAS